MGPEVGGTMTQKDALNSMTEAQEYVTVRCSTQKQDSEQKQVENCNTVGQDTCRDSTLHMARHAENAGRPTTSVQCAGQCGGSRWIGDH